MNAFSQSLIRRQATEARAVIELIGGTHGFAIDEKGRIQHQWLETCDQVFFGPWFVDALKSGKIRVVAAHLEANHKKKLRIDCGMPSARFEMEYVAVANRVLPPKYIVTDDIDFWEPRAKKSTEQRKQAIKTKRTGCVCEYLAALDIRIGTVSQALADLSS